MKSSKNFTSKHILWKFSSKLILILRLLFPFLSSTRNVSQLTKWGFNLRRLNSNFYLNLQTSGYYLMDINILQCINFQIMLIQTVLFNTKEKLKVKFSTWNIESITCSIWQWWGKTLAKSILLTPKFIWSTVFHRNLQNYFFFVTRKRKNGILWLWFIGQS